MGSWDTTIFLDLTKMCMLSVVELSLIRLSLVELVEHSRL